MTSIDKDLNEDVPAVPDRTYSEEDRDALDSIEYNFHGGVHELAEHHVDKMNEYLQSGGKPPLEIIVVRPIESPNQKIDGFEICEFPILDMWNIFWEYKPKKGSLQASEEGDHHGRIRRTSKHASHIPITDRREIEAEVREDFEADIQESINDYMETLIRSASFDIRQRYLYGMNARIRAQATSAAEYQRERAEKDVRDRFEKGIQSEIDARMNGQSSVLEGRE